jgi:hypothetical protein
MRVRVGSGIGFVWQLTSQRLQAFKFFDGAAIKALGLGLVAEEKGPGGGVLLGHVVEAGGEAEVAVLDFDAFGIDFK